MKITIKVKTNKKENKIVNKNNQLFIDLKSKPIKGLANQELISVLADFYNKPKNNIKIICGEKSKTKIVEIT